MVEYPISCRCMDLFGERIIMNEIESMTIVIVALTILTIAIGGMIQ